MLPAPADCLISLLGLAASPPACFPFPADADAQAAITASSTSLYLTMAEGLELRIGANATAATDLWQRLDNARTLAAQQVPLLLATSAQRGFALYQQAGTIGGQGRGVLEPLGTPASLVLKTADRPAGALRVRRLQLFTNAAVANVPLLLDGEQIGTISTNASQAESMSQEFVLPLDGESHTLTASLPEGVRPVVNKLFCFGCAGNSPWALSIKKNLPDVADSTPGRGFVLSLSEECTAGNFLCFAAGADEGAPDFRYPEVAKYLAHALLYKAAELFTVGILTGASTNRYTMLEPKMLVVLAERYQAKTLEYTGWLNSPDGLGQVQHPCFLRPGQRGPALVWTG
jgi:hypothetical protein